jgi:hypothetical protein
LASETILVAGLLLLGMTSGWHHDDGLEATWRIVAGATSLLVLVVMIRSAEHGLIQERQIKRTPTDPIYQPSLRWLLDRRWEAAAASRVKDRPTITFGAVEMLIEMLTTPWQYRDRTVEEVSLQGHLIKQHVSIEYSLPRGSLDVDAPMAYVPILVAPKGELIDNFHVSSGDGKSLSDLSYQKTVELMSLALHLLVIRACSVSEAATPPIGTPEPLDDAIGEIETTLLEIIARRGRIATAQADEDIREAFNELMHHASNTVGVDRLRSFVSILATAYPIVAVAPVDHVSGRILVKYERTIIPAPEYVGARERVRMLLGLRPYRVRLPLSLALMSRSYHLVVEGPTDQYLMGQWLWSQSSHALLTANHRQDRYFRVQRKRGQNYAHLYMRNFYNSDQRDPEFLVLFGEVPPGTLGTAVITAGAIAFLVWVAGQIMSHAKMPPDIAALILGLPAIAVSWFGFASDGESVLKCSVVARASLIASGLVSFGAVGLYLFQRSQRIPSIHFSFGLVGITDPWWSVIFSLAAINLLYTMSCFVVRWTYYRTLFEKKS